MSEPHSLPRILSLFNLFYTFLVLREADGSCKCLLLALLSPVSCQACSKKTELGIHGESQDESLGEVLQRKLQRRGQ